MLQQILLKLMLPPCAAAPDEQPSPVVSQFVPASTLFAAAPSRHEKDAAEETEDPASASQDLGKTP